MEEEIKSHPVLMNGGDYPDYRPLRKNAVGGAGTAIVGTFS